METVSENKTKRGRPKSNMRERAEHFARKGLGPTEVDSTRSKINHAFRIPVLGMFSNAPENEQIRVMGFTFLDIRDGTKNMPRGFVTAATELGRYMETVGDTEENKAALWDILLDARDNCLSWTDIKAHFRKLRLGEMP